MSDASSRSRCLPLVAALQTLHRLRDRQVVITTMGAARERFHTSAVARAALGDEVVEHYANMADVELAAYNSTVTDWELRRGFERL